MPLTTEQKVSELTEDRDRALDAARRLNGLGLNGSRYYDRAVALDERIADLACLQSVSKSTG